MINVKLIDVKNGEVVLLNESILEGNENLFCQEDEEKFPCLSEITEVDIERYFSSEMQGLISEFELLVNAAKRNSEKKHINEVIEMCRKCSGLENGQLVFDPFADLLKYDDGRWVKD